MQVYSVTHAERVANPFRQATTMAGASPTRTAQSAAMSFASTKGGSKLSVTLGTITPAVGMRSSCGNQVRSTDNSNASYGMGARVPGGSARPTLCQPTSRSRFTC